MKVLICGGAGNIGSHVVLYLQDHHTNFEPVVIDNLNKPSAAIEYFQNNDIQFYQCDIRDKKRLLLICEKEQPKMVVHLCADIEVGESVRDPLKYYNNNVIGAINLLEVMKMCNINKLIFSSTAAVFGQPNDQIITEDTPKIPINPYGQTKLDIENMLKYCDQAYGLKYVSLRYFNACGADPQSRIGENHNPETHLIPIIIQAALEQRENIVIFGTDYPTKDGTCVRDYIHVNDIASAHYHAMIHLLYDNSDDFNLGNGRGYTVREIIDTVKRITKKDFEVLSGPRREGDPATLITDSSKAKQTLEWTPKYRLDDIIQTSWNWHNNIN